MSEQTILARVKALVADLCGIEEATIDDEGRLLGYGLDSVRALDLFLAFEDELGVEIDEHDPELSSIKTVRQLAAFIERRTAGGSGDST
jgi:acyl carrier protein